MDIFFQDPDEIPLPPEEVRIRELRAEAWPDGQRVRVYLEVDPFQKRPSAELTLTGPDGAEAARASILETVSRQMELNLHLRPDAAPGEYTLDVTVYYQKLPGPEQPDAPMPEPLIVDRGQVSFAIPPR